MITALDTNILLDVLIEEAPHSDDTHATLGELAAEGLIVVSEPVIAEIAPRFATDLHLRQFLHSSTARFVPSGTRSLHNAGVAWREYTLRRSKEVECPTCGRRTAVTCTSCGSTISPRQHIVADFMIGAHALHHADRLLTRDRGFYGRYFPRLKLA